MARNSLHRREGKEWGGMGQGNGFAEITETALHSVLLSAGCVRTWPRRSRPQGTGCRIVALLHRRLHKPSARESLAVTSKPSPGHQDGRDVTVPDPRYGNLCRSA
jgi:hypothetical protein